MSVGKILWARLTAALLAGSVIMAAAAVSAHAQQTSGIPDATGGSNEGKTQTGTFGDWKLRCDMSPGSTTEQCIIQQNVVDDQSPDITLTVSIYKTADGKSRMMSIVAPLGVLLPNGLGLRVDNMEIGRVGFVRCLASGCAAKVRIEDGLLEQFRNGKAATFFVFKTPEQGVGIPISLDGFSTAYDKLPNVSP